MRLSEGDVQPLVGVILALALGQTTAPASTGGIAGRVTADETHAPIAGAHIVLFPARPPRAPNQIPIGPPPQTTTDQDGRFAFDRIEPGEYRINAQKSGFAPMGLPPMTPQAVIVVAGQQATVDLHLLRGGVISGRVLDPKGEPLTDAQVTALRRMPAPRNPSGQNRLLPAPMTGPQQTNDLGEFRISGLAPGDYVVAVMPRAFAAFGGPGVVPQRSSGSSHTTLVPTFYPGTVDSAAAQMLTVAAGAEVGNISFTVQAAPGYRVSGVVVDESGAPIADAMVMLNLDSRNGPLMFGTMGNGRSDANGRFAINDVPAGSYRANASVIMRSGSGGGGGFVSFSSGRVGGLVQPTEVVVTDSDVKGVRVVAQRPIQQ
jgi:hypothetical protein